MIISQEQAFLKAQTQLEKMCRLVEQSAEDGERIDKVERDLFRQLLAVGLTSLRTLLNLAPSERAAEHQNVLRLLTLKTARPPAGRGDVKQGNAKSHKGRQSHTVTYNVS